MWGTENRKRLADKRMRDILLIYGRILGLYGNSIHAILSEVKHNNKAKENITYQVLGSIVVLVATRIEEFPPRVSSFSW